MRIISALFNKVGRDYQVMADNLRKSVFKLGYGGYYDGSFVIYPLKDDPIEEFKNKGDYQTACFFKPHLILKALDDTKDDIIWLDIDCIVKARLDDILGDADIAVTLRRGSGLRNIYDGYLNAGVMAFRNNQASRNFIKKWISNIPGSRADQDALNKTLIEHTLFDKYNELVDCGFAKVMIRSCDEYNFFYFSEANNAKIYHIKGSLRAPYYNNCAKEVLGSEASLI